MPVGKGKINPLPSGHSIGDDDSGEASDEVGGDGVPPMLVGEYIAQKMKCGSYAHKQHGGILTVDSIDGLVRFGCVQAHYLYNFI